MYVDNEEELKNKYDDFKNILHSSKEFMFRNSDVLILREYYGNREVALNLSKIDEDMFKELFYDLDKEMDDDYDI